MKKFLSSVVVLSLCLTMTMPAMAAPVTGNETQDVVVSYGMGESFIVNVPANFSIDTATRAGTALLSAESVMIDPDSVLTVTLSGADYVDSWELVNSKDQNTTLTYTIGTTDGGNDVVNNTKVLTVNSGDAVNEVVEQTLYFTVVDELVKTGNYTDIITFAVEVKKELVEFKLMGETFYASKDMTWGEWVLSEYNIPTNGYTYEISRDNLIACLDSNGVIEGWISIFVDSDVPEEFWAKEGDIIQPGQNIHYQVVTTLSDWEA